jgi:mycothiol synthase
MSLEQTMQLFIENPTAVELQWLLPTLVTSTSVEEKQKIDFLLTAAPAQPVPWRGNADWSAEDFLNGLLVARSSCDASPIAAIWGHPAPGDTVLLGAPVPLLLESNGWSIASNPPCLEVQSQLVGAAVAWAQSFHCEMLQAIVGPQDVNFAQALQQNGIQKLVDLVFLSSPILTDSGSGDPTQTLTQRASTSAVATESPCYSIVPPNADNLKRWYRLLESTYVDSCDCPAINGRRSLASTVAGYLDTGTYWEQGWVILRELNPLTHPKLPKPTHDPGEVDFEQRDLGGFVMADHPASDFVEMIYFGISPLARGRGLGLQILQEASRRAQQLRRTRIITAVDRRNLPALRVYSAAHYTVLEERTVFARFFPVSNPGFDVKPKLR